MDHPDFIPEQPQPDQPLSSLDQVIYPGFRAPLARAVVDLKDSLFIVLVAVISLRILLSIAIRIAAGVSGQHLDPEAWVGNALVAIPTEFAGYLVTVAFMVWLIRFRHGLSFARGIFWNLPEKQLALTALAGGAVMALLSEISSGLLQRWTPKNLPIEEYFKNAASGYALALFGILVAPVVEEIFFRGFLYPALERWIGVVAGLVLTSAAFSLLHGGQLGEAWAPMLVLFLVSAVLTAVRIRTHSVATCVLVHMGYNATLFSIMFIYTQGFRHMEKLR